MPYARGMIPSLLQLSEATPHYAFAVSGDSMIVEWRMAITAASLHAFESFSDRASIKLQPGIRHMVGMVNEKSCTPSSAMRELMAEGLKRYAHRTGSSALIYEVPGLKASVVRSIATAMSMVARESVPIRTFATVREAAQWQSKLRNQPSLLEPLVHAVIAVRNLN